MIQIDNLKDLKGANKYGTCINCGIGTEDGGDIKKFTFSAIDASVASSICLCKDCRLILANKIYKDDQVDVTAFEKEHVERTRKEK